MKPQRGRPPIARERKPLEPLAHLTSPDTGRHILGMTLIFGIYLEVMAKIGQGSSSPNPPEVGRARIAALGDAH
jgi:hypothetical protein